jgi:hypothetical protein
MRDDGIWLEIMGERDRQDEKWGEQNHKSMSWDGNYDERGERKRHCAELQERCDRAAREGWLAWEHVVDEELAEVYAAESDAERRGELVQLAAVLIAWIECIDRRGTP